ncbi:hypothetical protein [Bartonella grahamii]|uniref:hypothetical protein n=1 Tax=Bartonella grahamii TaxID=33045 RepID=UPI001ABAAF03|nr:hypothetical protein [Bartonella grahamii]
MQKNAKKPIFFSKEFLNAVYPQPMTRGQISKIVKFAVYFMEKRQMKHVLLNYHNDYFDSFYESLK